MYQNAKVGICYTFQIPYKYIITFIRKKLNYTYSGALLKYLLLFATSEVTAVLNFWHISVVITDHFLAGTGLGL